MRQKSHRLLCGGPISWVRFADGYAYQAASDDSQYTLIGPQLTMCQRWTLNAFYFWNQLWYILWEGRSMYVGR